MLVKYYYYGSIIIILLNSEDRWLEIYQTVKDELDVAGKMAVDPQLKLFIQSKKSKSCLKDQYAPTDLLDCLETEIK